MKYQIVNSIVIVVLCVATAASSSRAAVQAARQEEAKITSDPSQELILQQLEELRGMILALQAEVSELRKAVDDIHQVAVRPRVPPAPSSVSLDDDVVMGGPDAKVAILEFSDFQCPYCRRFHAQTFPQIKETYIDTGKVRYVFRDFPLEQIHKEAAAAATAANCSGQQGKYWEMHHALFSNQGQFGPELFTKLAQDLDLDLAVFETCLENPAQKEEVMKDLAYGQSVGVRGTPHFFLGRIEEDKLVDVKRISGAQPFQSFKSIIDALLQ